MNLELKYNRLLVCDFSHILHRNIAQPNLWEMRDSYGRRTGGVYGSLNTLLKESSTYNYFPVAVFDGHLSPRRLAIYDNYKRYKDKQLLTEDVNTMTELELLQQEQRAEYNTQREIVKDLLSAFGIPVIHLEDWEGDDLIYILTKLSKDSIIVSDDKDMLQMICDKPERRCRVRRGMRDEFWDINTLKEKGIDQNEFIACKAIVGDPSDNIPTACFGVGEKTALGLYKLYCECTEQGTPFPMDEKQLAFCSKTFNTPKRKAYLNFDENQFYTNVLLMDLRLVENDINDTVIEQISNCITEREKYFDTDDARAILNSLNIETFNTTGLINNINRTKPFIFIDSYNPDEKILDTTTPLIGRLF